MKDVKIVCTIKEGSDVQLAMREICGREDVSKVVKVLWGVNEDKVIYE